MSDSGKPSTSNEKPSRIARLRARYPWLDHLLRAADAFGQRYGNHYAAAVTFFSVLALFPLLMIAVSAVAFMLAGDAGALAQLRQSIASAVPASLAPVVDQLISAAIKSKGTVGVLGLIVALYSGVGWIANLRDALTAQWGHPKQQLPYWRTLGKDLLALLGLGLALVVSFSITAAGSGAGALVLRTIGVADTSWARVLLVVLSIALSLIANWLVFLWVIARLPRERVEVRAAMRGAVVASIGFEVLKQVATIYLTKVSASPTGALFGPIIGLLVFANLVSRFLLFVTAWTATATEDLAPPSSSLSPPVAPVIVAPNVMVRRAPGVGETVGVFTVGALTGLLLRRRR